MHPTTTAVRAMYERFPYPAGPPTLRHGFDVRRLRACIDADRPTTGPLTVLDAGCGRGAGLIGMATAQTGVRFLGVDMNRVALAEVTEQAKQRGLSHVEVAEVDLETLEGLPVPEHGFDVIVSSGVLHHLVDPAASLAMLAERLAPWGVLDLMVYARPGRRGIEHVAAVIAERIPEGALEERLAAARALVRSRAEPAFVEAASLDDVEFVDRYLHPQFASYELDDLRELVESAGLRLQRWTDPSAFPTPPPDVDPWQAAAELAPRHKPRMWSPLLSHAGVGPRKRISPEQVDAAFWALNPEGTLERGTRTLWTGRTEGPVVWRAIGAPEIPLRAPIGPFLERIGRPFRGQQFIDQLGRAGIDPASARRLLLDLARHDVLYRPQPSDCASLVTVAASPAGRIRTRAGAGRRASSPPPPRGG